MEALVERLEFVLEADGEVVALTELVEEAHTPVTLLHVPLPL